MVWFSSLRSKFENGRGRPYDSRVRRWGAKHADDQRQALLHLSRFTV
jgi:hypothetical protein